MNQIAEDYADHEVLSIFLYTNEAHPGENFPHLTSMEQKFRHAQALHDVYGITRPILIDSLDGACHRAYGSMPNMTWIFNRAGQPVYKSNWTDANSVANALDYFTQIPERRSQGKRLAPFHVERLDYRNADNEKFYEGLARNGQKAVDEFRNAF